MNERETKDEVNSVVTKRKKIISIIISAVVLSLIITISIINYYSKWYSKINESKMVEVAKQEIRYKFNNVAKIEFHTYDEEIEYKDNDYNKNYYFMFYRISVTVTNYYNVKTDYYCTVKIIFYKETMEYNSNDVRIQKIN